MKKARTKKCTLQNSVDQRLVAAAALSGFVAILEVLNRARPLQCAMPEDSILLGSLCKVCSLKLWGHRLLQLLRAVLVSWNLTLLYSQRLCCHKSFGMYPGLMDEIGPSTGWAVVLNTQITHLPPCLV